MNNWQRTIYSQYANSGVLTGVIGAFNDAEDPATFIAAFYNLMWNVLTAAGYGLDVWGRIVGVSHILQVPGGTFFGFKEGGTTDYRPFGESSMYAGTPGSTSYALSDPAFRLLILAKALANISMASIPIYNAILLELFPGRGNAYVTDTGNMTETVTFEFALLPYEVAILKQSGALQPPTGVGFSIMQVTIPTQFGFKEAGYSAQSFNVGTFFQGFS